MKSSVIWSQSIHSFWFRASMNGQNAQKLAYYLFFFSFFFFLLHALFQWVVSYSILIHIIFVVSCELRIGMYWEFSVCRNLLCVNFFVKFVAPKSKHQSVLLIRFMSLLGSFFFWGQNESLSLLTHFGVCLAQWIMPSSLNFNYSEL